MLVAVCRKLPFFDINVREHAVKPARLAGRALAVAVTTCLAVAVCGVASSQSPASLGTFAVGKKAAPVSVLVTMTASGSGASTKTVTSGSAGGDFTLAPGSACDASVTYQAGSTCLVSVVFAPRFPGLRKGAVVVTDRNGRLLGSTLLSGNGTGSLSVLTPGVINTVAGDGELLYRSDGVLAVNTPIYLPQGVVADAAGNLYISDTNNNRIRRVDKQSGMISTIAGSGLPGYSGDGGLASAAVINLPSGITLDGAGNIYFVDSGNHAVRRIDAVSGNISTIAGQPTLQGYTGDGNIATAAKLSSPRGLVFDPLGNLYVADTGNNVVREISVLTGCITTVAGTGIAGYHGDGGLATNAQLNAPWGLAVGPDGLLYITDLANNVVRKVSSAGVISTVAGTGARGFSGDGRSAITAVLDDPAAVTFDPAGDLYIADSGNDRVRKVTANGIIRTIAGIDSEQFAGDNGPANLASMYAPYALFLDPSGNLFISDMLHNRIREIAATPTLLNYPDIRVGKISAPQGQGLENDGNDDLVLSNPTLVNAALDSASTTCSFLGPIAPDETCSLGVEFAPTTIGATVLGSVTLNSNAGNSPSVINLSGQVLSVNPVTISLTSSLNPSLFNAAVTFTAIVTSDDPNTSGPVTFYDGTVAICSNVALSGGKAICTTSTLALGVHNMTANYAGDANNEAKTSSTLLQTVQQSSTVALTVSPNPATVGTSVTLSANVSAASGTPTGLVTFYDGTAPLSGNVTLSGGKATFSTTQLTPGTHSLTAQYAGDTNDTAGTSNAISEVINQTTTTTTLASSNANVVVGTTVNFTAAVTSSNGTTPTGSVQFSEGGTVLGSAPLASSGTATLPLSSLAPGQHNIVATYSGDQNNGGSTSSALVETIQQIPTTTTLTSDTGSLSAGATVHLTAVVAINGPDAADGPISGLVTFTDAGMNIGTSQLDANGNATLAVILPAGSQSIVATYSGNTNYTGSTSNTLVEQVNNTATATRLSSSSASSLAGKPVTLTALVTSSTGVPTGSVSFTDGSTVLGVSALNQGVATLTTSGLSVTTHTIVATYTGDSNYLSSKSASLAEVVSLATTAVSLAGPAKADVATLVTWTGSLTSNGVTPTGTLTLLDGGTAVMSQNVSASGSFSFTSSTLSLGNHSISVSYAGDGNNSSSVSQSVPLVIQQAASVTSLASSANPSTLGQALTLTASVTSGSPGIGGSISFLDGTALLGSVAIANGTASFTTSTLPFGVHSLTAVYSGDANHATSTSLAVSVQIVEAGAATLASSANPATSGTNVIFTAHIAAVGSLVPTGSVTFRDGSNTLGVMTLDATGTATFQISTLAVRTHAISLSYGGDTNYAGGSASLTQTIQNANTQVVLTASASTATYGAALNLVATITSNGGVATGPVTFLDGTAKVGSAVLNGSGVAALAVSTLAPGVHTLTATYAGDGKASGSVSSPVTVTVLQNTSTALASSANPALTLNSVTFTATVTGSVGVPTGSITFTDGATQLGVVQVDAKGVATITAASMTAGNHALAASYSGDATNFPSTSTLAETVQLRPTSTAVTSSQTDVTNPQKVTLLAIVRYSGPSEATGTVTFTSGSTIIGSAQVNASGVANLTFIMQGTKEQVVGSYAGDSAYAGSDSASTAVTAGAPTQFTIALSPAAMTMPSKQHGVTTITLASIKDFSDMVELGCLGQPYATTCTFSKTQMQLDANGTATVQLTIDTGNPLGAGAAAGMGTGGNGRTWMLTLPLTLLMGFGLWRRGGRRSKLPALLLAAFAFALSLAVTGCAGLSTAGTPPGTYTFLVTAVGKGTGATQSQTVTLTVTQ